MTKDKELAVFIGKNNEQAKGELNSFPSQETLS